MAGKGKKKGKKIKRTKTQSQNVHARRRFLERFGIKLTKELKLEILSKIQRGWAQFIEKQSNRISLFDVFVNGTKIRVVYDKERKNIVSALYPEGVNNGTDERNSTLGLQLKGESDGMAETTTDDERASSLGCGTI